MDENKIKQTALREYYESLGTDQLIPVDENGLSEPDFSGLLIDLAEKEIIDQGHLIGVNPDGTLGESSLKKIEEIVECLIDELYKTEEERIEARTQRGNERDVVKEGHYNHMLNTIAVRYDSYTKICEKYGIEPKPLYEFQSKQHTL